MKLVTYTVADISRMLDDGTFWQSGALPVTRERAISQINNPRAAPTDVILVVAYGADGEVCAYIGMLPDRAWVGEAHEKFAWLTAWWVSPTNAPSGVGFLVLVKAMSCYQNKVAAQGFSDQALGVYAASRKFSDYSKLDGAEFEFFGKREIALWSVLNKLRQWISKARLRWVRGQLDLSNARLLEVRRVDEDSERMLRSHAATNISRRLGPDFDWIRDYPWVRMRNGTVDDGDYYFTRYADHFAIRFFKVLDADGQCRAFLIFKERDRRTELAGAYYDEADVDLVADVIRAHVLDSDFVYFSLFDESITTRLQRNVFPYSSRVNVVRRQILSKRLAEIIGGRPAFQAGDADCIFV